VRRTLPAVRAASAAVALLAAASAPGTAPARAADAELEKRVDALVQDLGEIDANVRAKAARELAQLGPAAVPLLLDRIPDDVASKRFAGVVDGIGAIDADGAIAEIESTRSEWTRKGWRRPASEKAPPKPKEPEPGRGRGREQQQPPTAPRGERWIDAVLDRLRTHRAASVRRSVALESGALWDVGYAAPWTVVALGTPAKRLPETIAGEAVPVREADGGKLEIDLAKDGKFATAVGSDLGRVVETGPRRTPRRLLVFRRLGAWYAAPGATLSGELDGAPVEFLDADLDGAFDGKDDLVRFAGGAFRRVSEEPTAWTSQGLVTWKLRRATEKEKGEAKESSRDAPAWFLDAETEPEPAWRTAEQTAEMGALNSWRQAVGLPPQRIDHAWSDACALHHEYWAKNGFSGHDEDKGRPAWTKRGAEAGQRSSVTNSPDGGRFVRDIAWTILHRQSCVGDAEGGVGAFAGPTGALLWGSRHDVSPRGFPILAPGAGQQDAPVACESEIPVPDRDPKYYATTRGAPVAVSWMRLGGRFAELKNLRLELFAEGTGEPLAGTLWSKENRYREDFASGFPEESAIFCAAAPLAEGTLHVARFRADGKEGPVEIVWQFRTGRP
jgi:hypothetical protein